MVLKKVEPLTSEVVPLTSEVVPLICLRCAVEQDSLAGNLMTLCFS